MTELAGGELCLQQRPHNQVGAARRRSLAAIQQCAGNTDIAESCIPPSLYSQTAWDLSTHEP